MKFIADENFPFPSYRLLISEGLDVIHVGSDFPSISDNRVLEVAVEDNRILLTFDRDHGDLIFVGKLKPPLGVIYFRLEHYHAELPGQMLLELLAEGRDFEGFFTVIKTSGIRRRPL